MCGARHKCSLWYHIFHGIRFISVFKLLLEICLVVERLGYHICFQMRVIQIGVSQEPISDLWMLISFWKVWKWSESQKMFYWPVTKSSWTRRCLARDDKRQGRVRLPEKVALLPCDFALRPLRDAVYFCIPLNLGRLCFYFEKQSMVEVMLCNFQAYPLTSLAASASCLLEVRH